MRAHHSRRCIFPIRVTSLRVLLRYDLLLFRGKHFFGRSSYKIMDTLHQP